MRLRARAISATKTSQKIGSRIETSDGAILDRKRSRIVAEIDSKLRGEQKKPFGSVAVTSAAVALPLAAMS